MRARGWSDGWIIDYALAYHPESEGVRARFARGRSEDAKNVELPSRVTRGVG